MKYFRRTLILVLTLILGIYANVLAIAQTIKDNSHQSATTKKKSETKLRKEEQEKLAKKLAEAILTADNQEVKKLIAMGVDLNSEKYAFLAIAAGTNQLEIVMDLLQAGANVNLELDEQATALTYAFFSGNVEITKKLISAGGKLFIEHGEEEKKTHWLSPLINLTLEPSKYFEILEIALSQGADPNEAIGESNWTLLMQAASQGNLPAVDLLIKSNANVSAKSSYGVTPCSCALSKGHIDIVKRLNDAGANCNPQQKVYKKSVVKTEFGKILIDDRIDKTELGVPIIEDFPEDLLDFIRRAETDIDLEFDQETQIKEIIGNNDVTARYGAGNTILMLIANENIQSSSKKASQVIDILIQAGADINTKNDQGDTALLIASRQRLYNSLILEKFIASGADLRIKDSKGKTALVNLIESNSTCNEFSDLWQYYYVSKIVEKLIKAGIDINAKDNDGKTALTYSVELQKSNGFLTLPFCKKMVVLQKK